VWLSEVMFIDRTRLIDTTGGTAISGGDYSGAYPASKAFDHSLNGLSGEGWASASNVWPAWIGYVYPLAVDIVRVDVYLSNAPSAGDELPVAGSVGVEYSDDGVQWTDAGPVTESGAIKINAKLTLTLPDAPPITLGWWTAVAGLTPIAAFDATRFTGTKLLDGVGNNHITLSNDLSTSVLQTYGIYGNSNPMVLSLPIPVPENGVVAAFWSPKRRNVLLSNGGAGNGNYMLHQSDNLSWYAHTLTHGNATYGNYGSIGASHFVALVTRGTDSILYVDGNLMPTAVSMGHVIAQITQVGYGGNGNEYNLDSDEILHGLGVWSGSPTQTDIVALEAVLRLALVSDVEATFHGFGANLSRVNTIPALNLATHGQGDNTGRINTAPMQALDGLGVRNKALVPILGKHDIYFGGVGEVAGTVKNTPATPVRRRVLLIEEATRAVIRETWSEAATGAYSFGRVAMNTTYTVVSYDHTQAFRAVVADRVMPELMPELMLEQSP
jgi:hypothetical protein